MRLIDADALINELVNSCNNDQTKMFPVWIEKQIDAQPTIPYEEQKPHVLSREEMIVAGENHNAVYVEEGNGRCFWGLAVEGIDPPEDKPYNYPGGVLFNVVDAYGDVCDGDFYLMCDVYPERKPHPMGWRAWNMKPTLEQMKAVKLE